MHAGLTSNGRTIVPTLRYRDVAAAIDWLCNAFGFEKHLVVAGDEGSVRYAELTFGDGMIMLGPVADTAFDKLMTQPDQAGGAETQICYLFVADAAAHRARAGAAGAEIVLDLEDEAGSGRGYSCRDPEGHTWNFGTYNPWKRQSVTAAPRRGVVRRMGGVARRAALAVGFMAITLASAAAVAWALGFDLESVAATGLPIEIDVASWRSHDGSGDRDPVERALKEARDQLARERTARESMERASRSAREQAGQERGAREAAERVAKDAQGQLTAERSARETAERGLREAREQVARTERERTVNDTREQSLRDRSVMESAERIVGETRQQLVLVERAAEEARAALAEEREAREAAERASKEARELLAKERGTKDASERAAKEAREQLAKERNARRPPPRRRVVVEPGSPFTWQ